MKSGNFLTAAIEIGGTNTLCSVGNDASQLDGNISRIDTGTDPEETLRQLHELLRKKEHEFGAKIDRIGIASFGPLCLDACSPAYGSITTTPKKGWMGCNLLGRFHELFPDAVIRLDTDVNGSALGEHFWGAAKGIKNFIYITIGTGIGAGIMVEGRLHHGLAHPEVGHMLLPRVENDLFIGVCGFHRDCWEGLCSGPALVARTGRTPEQLEKEHPVWDIEIQYISLAIYNIVCLFSPELVIIGGGISHAGKLGRDEFFWRVRRTLVEYVHGYGVLPNILLENMEKYIVPPVLENNSGIFGAFALARNQLNSLW